MKILLELIESTRKLLSDQIKRENFVRVVFISPSGSRLPRLYSSQTDFKSNRGVHFPLSVGSINRSFKSQTMATYIDLAKGPVEIVDIDGPGNTFKYVLLKLSITKEEGGEKKSENHMLVRGYIDCPFHGDIYERTEGDVKKKLGKVEGIKWKLECLGGGRIKREIDAIEIYGYSQGYGQADHSVAAKLIRATKGFESISITMSKDGY